MKCTKHGGLTIVRRETNSIAPEILPAVKCGNFEREGQPMVQPPSSEVTKLLRAWGEGDESALSRVVKLVYPELRDIARRCLSRERPAHTIQATALVHEAYLRLVDIKQVGWQDRVHFLAVGARVMRRILVDYARARDCAKREGLARRTTLNDALVLSSEPDPMVIQLHEALERLAEFDTRRRGSSKCAISAVSRPTRLQQPFTSHPKREPRLEPGQSVAGSGNEQRECELNPSAGH